MLNLSIKNNMRFLCLFVFFLITSSLSLFPVNIFGQDTYEEDNTFHDATVIVVNDLTFQQHDLHTADDNDWVMFYALDSITYQVEVTNSGAGIDPYIELYDQDGVSILDTSNSNGSGNDETLLWHCNEEGVYFVKIGHDNQSPYAGETGYHLELITPDLLTLPGYLTGTIRSKSGVPIPEARIKVENTTSGARGSGISLPNGSFIVVLEQGSCLIEVQASGYTPNNVSVYVEENVNVNINLNTIPVAKSDFIETARNTTVSGNVLENDIDGDGDPLLAVLDSDVLHGTLNLDNNGQFTYTHNGGDDKTDRFIYHASDGWANSNMVEVTISIGFKEQTCLPFLMLLLNNDFSH